MAPRKNAPPADLGKLTFASLREHMRFSGGKTVLQHFRDLDLDASGELNKKEFAKAVKAMGFPSATKEEVTAVWEVLDKNGDGTIPYKELDKKLREKATEKPAAPPPETQPTPAGVEASSPTSAGKGSPVKGKGAASPKKGKGALSPKRGDPSRAATKPNGERRCLHPGCRAIAHESTNMCVAHGGEKVRCRYTGCGTGCANAACGDSGLCAEHGGLEYKFDITGREHYIRPTLAATGHATHYDDEEKTTMAAKIFDRMHAEEVVEAQRDRPRRPHWFREKDPHRHERGGGIAPAAPPPEVFPHASATPPVPKLHKSSEWVSSEDFTASSNIFSSVVRNGSGGGSGGGGGGMPESLQASNASSRGSARDRPHSGSAIGTTTWAPTVADPDIERMARSAHKETPSEVRERQRRLETTQQIGKNRDEQSQRRRAARKAARRAAKAAEEAPLPTSYPDGPNWAALPQHVREANERARADRTLAEEGALEMMLEARQRYLERAALDNGSNSLSSLITSGATAPPKGDGPPNMPAASPKRPSPPLSMQRAADTARAVARKTPPTSSKTSSSSPRSPKNGGAKAPPSRSPKSPKSAPRSPRSPPLSATSPSRGGARAASPTGGAGPRASPRGEDEEDPVRWLTRCLLGEQQYRGVSQRQFAAGRRAAARITSKDKDKDEVSLQPRNRRDANRRHATTAR
jgi:hypothetical protein